MLSYFTQYIFTKLAEAYLFHIKIKTLVPELLQFSLLTICRAREYNFLDFTDIFKHYKVIKTLRFVTNTLTWNMPPREKIPRDACYTGPVQNRATVSCVQSSKSLHFWKIHWSTDSQKQINQLRNKIMTEFLSFVFTILALFLLIQLCAFTD